MGVFARGQRNLSQDAMAALGPGAHPRISIKGNHFALVDAAGTKYPWPMLVLPVVIVGANPKVSKIFYDGPYDPDNPIPPACFSDNGIAPSSLAGEPQARTCQECPHFSWGSKINEQTGKKSKACSDRKKIAVMVPGDTTRHCYELQVPPASLKALNIYSALIASMTTPDGSRGADLPDIVTLVEFVPDAVGELSFRQWGWIDSVGPDFRLAFDVRGNPVEAPDGGETFAAFVEDLWEGDTVDKLVNIEDQPWHGANMGAIGAAPQAYLESQPQGGSLQRGSTPQSARVAHERAAAAPQPVAGLQGGFGQPTTPFTPPPGAQPQQPVQATPPKATRGGARTGAGRKASTAQPPATVAPATGPSFAQPAAAAAPAVAPSPFAGQPSAAAPPGAQPRAVADDGVGLPYFLKRDANNQLPTGNGVAPLQEAQAPGAEMNAALARAFSMDTTRN